MNLRRALLSQTARSSHSRWLLAQVRWEIDRADRGKRRPSDLAGVFGPALAERPFTVAAIAQAGVFVLAWLAGAITLFPNVTAFEVSAPSTVIATAWQVLAGFASIAFAGLAVLMQLTAEPVVTSRGVRQVLFEESQFRPVLAFSIMGAAQVGAATLFLEESEAAILEVAVVALTILWIGCSYARVGKVYADPGEALRLGEKALLRDLKASMREAHTRAVAEARLHDLVPREWLGPSSARQDAVVLVSADRTRRILDVDFELLSDTTRDLASDGPTSFTASDAPIEPQGSLVAESPQLRVGFSLGSEVDPGQALYILVNSGSFTGSLAQLRRRLQKTLLWEERS